MPTSARHHASLSAATETYRATPVGPTALPQLSTHALDAQRSRVADELDRAVAQVTELDTASAELERSREAARSVGELAVTTAAAADAQELQRSADAAAATERLATVDAGRSSVAEELAATTAHVDAVAQLLRVLDDTIVLVGGRSLTPDEVRTVAGTLDEVASGATDAGIDDTAAALRSWSCALADGTAPLHPSAAVLLAELDDLEREWSDHASGDLMADPEVMSLQTALGDARGVRHDIEAQASSGALGGQTMSTIRAASARRTEIEGRGNKADAEELRAAIAAETDALQLVGFDSMLDFHIATSTGGAGTLVEARRGTAAARVAELESELALQLGRTVAVHADLRTRFEQLHSRGAALVGSATDQPLDAALRGLLVVPEDVHTSRQRLDETLKTWTASLDAQQLELRALEAERPSWDLRQGVAQAAAAESARTAAQARRRLDEASATILAVDAELEVVRMRRREAEDLVASTTRAVQTLGARRYLEDDRRQLSDALIATLFGHATWLASHVAAPDGVGPTAMVVDDPLDELDDVDAVRVLDEMAAVAWPLPVVYVTSRPKLVHRLRSGTGNIRCIDGRRKVRAPRRLSKRHDEGELQRS